MVFSMTSGAILSKLWVPMVLEAWFGKGPCRDKIGAAATRQTIIRMALLVRGITWWLLRRVSSHIDECWLLR